MGRRNGRGKERAREKAKGGERGNQQEIESMKKRKSKTREGKEGRIKKTMKSKVR